MSKKIYYLGESEPDPHVVKSAKPAETEPLIIWIDYIGQDIVPTPDFILMIQRYHCLN